MSAPSLLLCCTLCATVLAVYYSLCCSRPDGILQPDPEMHMLSKCFDMPTRMSSCTELLLCCSSQHTLLSLALQIWLLVGSACLPSMMRACAEVQEMLAVARPLDLTQNIFQDGQWGTLRYALLISLLHPTIRVNPMP